MKRQTKKTAIITCIITGTCILAGSAFASYSTANGYDVYKKSLKGMIGSQNYTMDLKIEASIDGRAIDGGTRTEKFNKDGKATCSVTETGFGSDFISESIYQGGKYYYKNNDSDVWNYYDYADGYEATGGMLAVEGSDKDTVNKVVRFTELLADAVVGDLKNNFVYVSGAEDGGAKYSIELDSVQIPEIINAGISALCSLNNTGVNYDSDYIKGLTENDFEYYMYGDMALKSAKCEFSVDNNGRMKNNVIKADFTVTDINGQTHDFSMSGELNMSDYGTTVPDALSENAKTRDLSAYEVTDEGTETNGEVETEVLG